VASLEQSAVRVRAAAGVRSTGQHARTCTLKVACEAPSSGRALLARKKVHWFYVNEVLAERRFRVIDFPLSW